MNKTANRNTADAYRGVLFCALRRNDEITPQCLGIDESSLAKPMVAANRRPHSVIRLITC